MKKTLLLSLIAMLCFGGVLQAQNILLSTEDEGELEDGQVITVTGDIEETLIAHITVQNTSDSERKIKVYRDVIEATDGSMNYYCWGVCYTPTVDTSLQSITLAAGATTNEFSADFLPQGTEGTSIITYHFYDETNIDETTSVEVHYVAETASAATFTLFTEDDEEIAHEEVITVEGTLDESTVVSHIKIRNDSELPVNVMVRRVVNNTVEGSSNLFCWGSCYSPTVDTSLSTVTLEPGVVNSEFAGDYYHEGNTGTTSVSYYFYEDRNTENEIGVEIHYVVEVDGIHEQDMINALSTYPNPADNQLNLEFRLTQFNDAYITVNNMVGATIMNKQITEMENQISLNTSRFVNGIYFYTIMVDGAPVATEKFIIAH